VEADGGDLLQQKIGAYPVSFSDQVTETGYQSGSIKPVWAFGKKSRATTSYLC
jgi:hypothetical protein